MSEIKKPKRHSPLSHVQSKDVSSPIRERVLKAAFTLFREHGFSSASMLDIVTRARVSKRDLYGDPAVLAVRYLAVLWGDLLIRLLMRLREAPTEREIEVRARAATETLMALR